MLSFTHNEALPVAAMRVSNKDCSTARSVTADFEMLLFVTSAGGRLRCDILSHAANHFQIARRHYAHRHHRIRVGGRG